MSGREFLRAAVAGYEIGPRVGICMGPEHIGQGWHSGATLGVFSAAAGARAASKLDADKTVHALGIAGTQAAGLMAAQYGAMVKRMHAGRSSQSGLYGALFAEGRLHRHRQRARKRVRRLLHHVLALARPLQPRGADRGPRRALADDGRRAQVLFLRRQQPHHARRDPRHAGSERPFGPDDVGEIVVHGSQVTMDHVGWKYVPQGLTSAQLNLPYCVATLLLEGDCFVDQFTEDMVADPERMALAREGRGARTTRHHRAGAKFRHMVRVEAHLKDGTAHERTRRGAARQRTIVRVQRDMVDKFNKLVRAAMPKGQQDTLVQAVLGMEDLPKAKDLIRLLRTDGK